MSPSSTMIIFEGRIGSLFQLAGVNFMNVAENLIEIVLSISKPEAPWVDACSRLKNRRTNFTATRCIFWMICHYWKHPNKEAVCDSKVFFSRRFSRKKCPTLTVASFFFLFFVRPQTSSRMYHFLQTSLSLTCTCQYSVYGEPSGHGFESLL